MPHATAAEPSQPDLAGLRARLDRIPFITQAQKDRWGSLLLALEAVRLATGGSEAGTIDSAARILDSTRFRIIVCGRSGDGKSSLLNALLGRVLLDTGPITAITGTVLYIEPASDESAAEELVIDYLTQDEVRDRVKALAAADKANLDREYDITDDADRKSLRTFLDEREQSETGWKESLESPDRTARQLIRHCIDAYEANAARYRNGRLSSDRFTLAGQDEKKIRDLLREAPDLGKAGNLSTPRQARLLRLIRSATFKIRPGRAADLFAGEAVCLVDVPGFGASMPWHEAIASGEIARDDSVVLLVLNYTRLDPEGTGPAVRWLGAKLLDPLTGAARDTAAGKVFVAVNNFVGFGEPDAATIDPDDHVKAVLMNLSGGYWDRYKHRGDNGRRPYIETMPLAALEAEDPGGVGRDKVNPYKAQTAEALHRIGAVQGTPLTSEVREQIVEVSGVALLRRRLAEYVRGELIDARLGQAAALLMRATTAQLSVIDARLTELGLKPPYGQSGRVAEDKYCRIELDQIEKLLTTEIGPQLLAAQMAPQATRQFADSAKRGLADITGKISSIVDDASREQPDFEVGRMRGDLATNAVLRRCQADFRGFLHRFGLDRADDRVAAFRAALQAQGLRGILADAALGQSYVLQLPDGGIASGTLDELFDEQLAAFCQGFRSAHADALTYEDLRGDPERLFKEVGPAPSAEGEQNLASKIEKAYATMLTEVITKEEAVRGLSALFGRHLTIFCDQLTSLAEQTVRQHSEHYQYVDSLRSRLLARAGQTVAEAEQLIRRRADVVAAQDAIGRITAVGAPGAAGTPAADVSGNAADDAGTADPIPDEHPE